MSVRVRATVDVTETRKVEVIVPVSHPDDVLTRNVYDAIDEAGLFDGYRVTDYEVLEGDADA